MLSETVDFQSAREVVRKAKRALKDAEHRFDAESGPENSSSLIAEIKLAEKRLAEAATKLRELDS